MIPRGAWAWGTPQQRELGGFPIRMLADSVLPYTTPPLGEEDPPDRRPTWWEPGATGQFEGWHRNFANGTEVPNYPNDRFLNAVLVTMIGLKQSATAPFRFELGDKTRPIKQKNENVWPFDEDPEHPTFTPVPALDVLNWYAESYRNSGLKMIITIPERDFMNFAGDSTNTLLPWEHAPDNEAGLAAIIAFVRAILMPTEEEGGLGLGDVVIGWYLVDEPDQPYRTVWATPAKIAQLRYWVRRTEMETRREFDPAYAALSEAEQIAALRPCIITLSVPFILESKPQILPEDFNSAVVISEEFGTEIGAADIYGFDWYPFKRLQMDINLDYPPECPNPPPCELAIYLEVDPVKSIRGLRQLRQRLNPTSQPGDANYKAVFHWQQTDGWPFHLPGDSPSPTLAPAIMSGETDIDICKPAIYRRTKLYATLDLQQFYNWAGALEFSEGTCGFGQTGAPDIRLRDEFAKVACEMEYFAGLRHSSIDRSEQIIQRTTLYGRTIDPESRDSMPPVVLYLDYMNQPSAPLGTANRWLIIVNRHYLSLRLGLTFKPYGPIGHFRLQRINFLTAVGSPIILSPSTNHSTSGTIPPYSVRIYQALPG